MNPMRRTLGHVVVKMVKVEDKEITLKVVRKEQVTSKGNPRRLSADFSAANLSTKRKEPTT